MTQRDLNRAVARATGENISTIAELGFVPLWPADEDRPPHTMDWDQADADRKLNLTRRRQRAPALA